MSVGGLLERLERVRQTGAGRWVARCPAHQDRTPSLSIRELEDGRVLLHDFGGCDTSTVLAALGLQMASLFPERLRTTKEGAGYPPSHSRIPARDVLDLISADVSVVAFIAADFLGRRAIAEHDWVRLARAVHQINAARDYTHGR